MLAIPTLQQWQLYETMPVPCIILTPELRVVAVNNAFLLESCLERESVIQANFFELINAEERVVSSMLQSFERAMLHWGTQELTWLRYSMGSKSDKAQHQFWNIKNVAIKKDGAIPAHIIHFATKANTDTSFLADITRNIEDPIITTDKDLNITRWNRAAERMFGWKAQEAIGKNTSDILRAQLVPEVRSAIISDINKAGYWQGEVVYLNKAGQEVYGLCTVSEIKDVGNKASGNLILIKDISKRILAEKSLSKLNAELECRVEERTRKIIDTEQKYQQLFENSPMAVWVVDNDFSFLTVNEKTISQYGYNRSQFSSMHLKDFFKEEEWPLFKNMVTQPDFNSILKEHVWKHKKQNGQIIQVELMLQNTTFENMPAKMILANDISARVNAEAKVVAGEKQFRNTLDNMLEGAQIISFEWKYVYVNDTLVATSHYSREQLLGYNITDVYPGIENTNVFKVMKHVMDTREPQQLENEFVFPNGNVSYFQLSIQPVPEGIFVLSIDITERKNAEIKIADSQASLHNILERISDSFIALDTHWNYVYVNKAAGRMLNRNPEELIGKNMHEEFPEIVSHHFQAAYTRAMQTQEHIQEEGYYAPLGLWLQNNIYPSPQGLSLFFNDITQRKNTELELRQSEENLKAIFENSSEGFILTDAAGIVKEYNNNIVDSLLLSVSDNIKEGETIFNVVETDRRDFFIGVFNRVLQGETVQYDRKYISKKGHPTWVNLVFNPVKVGNHVKGVCISGRDVTNQKNAQEQLKKSFAENLALAERLSVILNNLPANIALVNKDGLIVEVNNAWRHFDADGFKGKDFDIGRNYIAIARSAGGKDIDDRLRMANGVEDVLANKLDEFIYEYSSQDKAGEKWYRMIVTPLGKAHYSGAVIMHMDISEIRKLETERMRRHLEQQQQITQAFLQGQEKERNHIGQELHDNINQILAGTRMYLSIAGSKDNLIKESIKYPIELLDRSIEEIRMLCSNMVTPLEDVHLKEMIDALLTKLRQQSIKIMFEYHVPGNPLSDELKLNIYRILQELSNNISKYAAATLVNISIWLKDSSLELVVTDDGKGFDVNDKRNGIGISNIRSRVKSFGGKLEILSNIGKGTKTMITIPNVILNNKQGD